jgi:hypothetical protein
MEISVKIVAHLTAAVQQAHVRIRHLHSPRRIPSVPAGGGGVGGVATDAGKVRSTKGLPSEGWQTSPKNPPIYTVAKC